MFKWILLSYSNARNLYCQPKAHVYNIDYESGAMYAPMEVKKKKTTKKNESHNVCEHMKIYY